MPLPDGLGESGLLVALGNMPRSKTAPLLVRIPLVQNSPCFGGFFHETYQEEIERPGVEVSLDNFDFLVAATNSNLEDLLSTSARLAKLHPGLKVARRIEKF